MQKTTRREVFVMVFEKVLEKVFVKGVRKGVRNIFDTKYTNYTTNIKYTKYITYITYQVWKFDIIQNKVQNTILCYLQILYIL